ncbi:MAG: flagellar hook-basal body complex protein, partial [Defluviitaleaceae bacterium]|nr:flagellar hook-basal body complex protein [Defluviitaleaceae bacterium]
VCIEGGGFFIVQDRGGNGANLFTRTGRIERDADWNLHIGGNMLMGWGTRPCTDTPGGHAVERGLLQPIRLDGDKRNMPSEPTTRHNVEGNLNITQLAWDEVNQVHYRNVPSEIFDSLGNKYTITMRYELHGKIPHPPDDIDNAAAHSPHTYWTVEVLTEEYDPATGLPPAPNSTAPAGGWPLGVRAVQEGTRDVAYIGVCLFGTTNQTALGFGETMMTKATIAFNSNGDFVGMGRVTEDGGPMRFLYDTRANTAEEMTDAQNWVRGREFNFSVLPIHGVSPSATFGRTPESHPVSTYSDGVAPNPPVNAVQIAFGTITYNFMGLGQRGQASTSIRSLRVDGGGPGTLEDIRVSADGTIMGLFSNGRDRVLGQIPLAYFSNPAGLERVGNSFWRTSPNSGAFDGVGLIGSMQGGALEGSNVDLANEFTDMITTQRGFQAASRTITVSDEMLQELVNLRR